MKTNMNNHLIKTSLTTALLAIAAITIAPNTARAEDSMKPDGTKHEKMAMMDGCMMMDGKMMECKDGKHMAMTKDMEMTDGTKVMMNGKVMMKDGKTMMMKDGDMVGMDGKMTKVPAAKTNH